MGQDQHGAVARLVAGRTAPPRQGALWPAAHHDPGLRRGRLFIAALRQDRIDAPFVFNQPIKAQSFTVWAEQRLAPTLAPGDVVVMDNLSSHKRPAVRSAIRARGAQLLFLPPPGLRRGRLYSPDLNPIEQVFAKLKHLLRKAAERTHEATWWRIGNILDTFPPTECANYLAHSGYASA